MTDSFVSRPEDLRNLSLADLELLAAEMRQLIISTCLKNGGHLGASLGTVELAIGLHSVFHSPEEPIVWDVGHQAYAHKIITGRRDRFSTLRQLGGISGFLQREESPHDVFGAGHSSTALSAVLAIAWAKGRENHDSPSWTVAVVGDGSLTAGLAFEALNNFKGRSLGPVLLVLNDNQMSISENVGSIHSILSGGQAKEFFGLFGFDYVGPVDGHDLDSLIGSLHGIKQNYSGKPIVLHALTQKGKGYIPAEESPATYHGVTPVQQTQKTSSAQSTQATSILQKPYSVAFGEALCKLAERDPRIVAITAAMPEGTGLHLFAQRFPDRFFDVGIAEAHAVTFAAGLATQGLKPVVAIYSTFLQRALDSIIHDVALQNLGVTFAIDRAGIVGADGPTHHGVFDMAFLGMIPNVVVKAPSSIADLEGALAQGIASNQPWFIRYPRGSGVLNLDVPEVNSVRWHRLVEHPKMIVIGVGPVVDRLSEVVKEVDPDSRWISLLSTTSVKPLALDLTRYLDQNPNARIFCFEEGVVRNGFGQGLASHIASNSNRVWEVGYEDHFISHGSPSELENREGLSKAALVNKMRQFLKS